MTLWEDLTKKRIKLSEEQIEELRKLEAQSYFDEMKQLRIERAKKKAQEDIKRLR